MRSISGAAAAGTFSGLPAPLDGWPRIRSSRPNKFEAGPGLGLLAAGGALLAALEAVDDCAALATDGCGDAGSPNAGSPKPRKSADSSTAGRDGWDAGTGGGGRLRGGAGWEAGAAGVVVCFDSSCNCSGSLQHRQPWVKLCSQVLCIMLGKALKWQLVVACFDVACICSGSLQHRPSATLGHSYCTVLAAAIGCPEHTC